MEVKLKSIAAGLAAGSSWWLGALRDSVPRRLRTAIAGSGPSLWFEAIGPDLLVRGRRPGRRVTIARLAGGMRPEAVPDEASSGLRDRIDAAGYGRGPVLIRLDRRRVLRRRIDLPAAAEASLAEVIAFEIDRRTPFRSDKVVVAHRVVGRRPDAARIAVEIAVVPRTALAPILDRIARTGLPAPTLEIALPDAGFPVRLPLHDGTGAPRRRRMPWTAGLAAFAILLLIAGVAVRLTAAESRAAGLEAAVKAAAAEANAVDRLRKDLDLFEQESRFPGDRKAASPPVLTILAELTRLLPDDTWLTAVRTRRDTVEIVGQSTAAAGLLRRIEEAPLFRNANFSSPVTRADDNLERFNLIFELRTPLQTRTAQR